MKNGFLYFWYIIDGIASKIKAHRDKSSILVDARLIREHLILVKVKVGSGSERAGRVRVGS